MIRLSKAKLRQELVVWQGKLEQRNSWSVYEGIGRLLYWLGEPEHSEYLRSAAHAYLRTNASAYALLTAGNLLRLAGDTQQAQALWTESYEKLIPTISEYYEEDLQTIIECCFFLRRYTELAAYAQEFAARSSDRELRAFAVARLAAADQAQDKAEVMRVAEQFAEWIRTSRSKIPNTGQISLWDWYEIALRRAQDLGADIPEGALP